MFAERGFAAGSLDDVAAAAGLTKGAIYSSFRTKDELVLALMEEHVRHRLAAAAEALTHAGPTAGPRNIGLRLFQAVHAEPEWHRLFLEYWTHAMRDPRLREPLLHRRRELHDLIIQEIQRAVDDHGLKLALPAEQLAVAVLALSNGVAIESLIDPDAVPQDLLGRLLERLIAR